MPKTTAKSSNSAACGPSLAGVDTAAHPTPWQCLALRVDWEPPSVRPREAMPVPSAYLAPAPSALRLCPGRAGTSLHKAESTWAEGHLTDLAVIPGSAAAVWPGVSHYPLWASILSSIK